MDECDQAEEKRAAQEEFERKHREAMATRLAAMPPTTECEECGDPLTPIRQLYRWTRCVGCQEIVERSAKAYRKGMIRGQ